MMIQVRSTPQAHIRADQVGDWWFTRLSIVVHVLETMSPESQLAVAIHELVEAYLCREHGVSDKAVVAFDEQYEKERKEGKHSSADEPGDDPAAPYREEHRAATMVEKAVCEALGLSWQEHEQWLQELEENHQKMESPAPSPAEPPEPPLQDVPD